MIQKDLKAHCDKSKSIDIHIRPDTRTGQGPT